MNIPFSKSLSFPNLWGTRSGEARDNQRLGADREEEVLGITTESALLPMNLHRTQRTLFPLTRALSPGRGESLSVSQRIEVLACSAECCVASPSPWGEGRREGEWLALR